MFKLKTVALAAGLMALPALSQAAAPTLTDVLTASGVTLNGYVDTGYTYSNTTATSGAFSGAPNTFLLHQAAFTLAKQPTQGFGGLVNVIAGEDAKVINPSSTGNDFALTQAFVQYATGGLTVYAGRFVTLAGMEVINPTMNANVSRSVLFSLQSLLHDGVRVSYKFNDMLTVTGGLVNSQFAPVLADNKQKTIEASVALTPINGLTVALTDYYGAEGAGPGHTTNNETDLVASYALTPALSLGLNADYFSSQSNAVDPGTRTTQTGIAGYASYQVLQALKASLRYEHLSGAETTTGGVTTKGFGGNEFTLTLDYAAAPNFDLLGEIRNDRANGNAPFTSSSASAAARNNQGNVSVTAIYKF